MFHQICVLFVSTRFCDKKCLPYHCPQNSQVLFRDIAEIELSRNTQVEVIKILYDAAHD